MTRVKCVRWIALLEERGHELRRPHADLLRDGIYELRVDLEGIHYRILYFFSGRGLVLLSHGITKERKVPDGEIDLAVERRKRFEADPVAHAACP